ncbi:serine/threonine protein kinase, partial [Actinocrinis puniceicyclus]
MTEPKAVPGYHSLTPIAEGRLGTVYRAVRDTDGRTMALKVITVGDAALLQRFEHDAGRAASLARHPHLALVQQYRFTGHGRAHLAMDYFEHRSLGDLVAGRGALPAPEVVRIGQKIASALAAAHTAGLLHGAVTPHHILIGADGEPALAGLDTACLHAGNDHQQGTRAASHLHTAPEVLEHGHADERCDLYSLGSTLYYLLEARPPFDPGPGPGFAQLLIHMLTEDHAPWTRTDLPPALIMAIDQCLARDPGRRPATATELADALHSGPLPTGPSMVDYLRRQPVRTKPPFALPPSPTSSPGHVDAPGSPEATFPPPSQQADPNAAGATRSNALLHGLLAAATGRGAGALSARAFHQPDQPPTAGPATRAPGTRGRAVLITATLALLAAAIVWTMNRGTHPGQNTAASTTPSASPSPLDPSPSATIALLDPATDTPTPSPSPSPPDITAPSPGSPSPTLDEVGELRAFVSILQDSSQQRRAVQDAVPSVEACAFDPATGIATLNNAVQARNADSTAALGLAADAIPSGATMQSDLISFLDDSATADLSLIHISA